MRFKIAAAAVLFLPLSVFAAPPLCDRAVVPNPDTVAAHASSDKVNVKDAALSADVRQSLEFLCWKLDAKNGFMLSPNSRALTKGELEAFLSDYDPIINPITADERSALYLGPNCRFDAHHVLCFSGQGLAHPLSNLDEAVFKRDMTLQESKSLSERIESYLSSQPGDKPLSKSALSHIAALSNNMTGQEKLPRALAEEVRLDAGLSAGDLRGSFQRIARNLDLFFDGQTSVKDLRAANQFPSIHTGEWQTAGQKPYLDSSESRVGRLCRKETIAVLSQNPVGREVLDHFKDKKGIVRLPSFLIGDLGDFDDAAYLPGHNTVILNKKYLLQDKAFSILPKNEKKILLFDSDKMNAWFAGHPDVVAAFVKNDDFAIAHELTHAWLDRKIPLGPYDPADILENEYEAFTAQMRYMQAQILAHPQSSLANSNYQDWMEPLESFLANYNQFRQHIAAAYLSGDSVAAADIPTALDIVESQEKNSMFLAAASRSWSLIKKELLKTYGLAETQNALNRFGRNYRADSDDFEKGEYPAMKRQAQFRFPMIAQRMLAQGAAAASDAAAESKFEDAFALTKLAASAASPGDAFDLAKDGALFSRIHNAEKSRASADISKARAEKHVSSRYDDIYYACRFAKSAMDPKLEEAAGQVSRTFIAWALKPSGKNKKSIQKNLAYAQSLATTIGDQELLKEIHAALMRAKHGG
ncbi:MAG: hypothetical protein ACYCPQ_03895 [Elusimicrobiota bacterium]